MAFRGVKQRVIQALLDGTYQHEARNDIEEKNALMMGDISPDELIGIIKICNGNHHASSNHHFDPSIQVHVLKHSGWYIKFYFLDPDTMFISVHQ